MQEIKEKIFRMVDVGFVEDAVSRAYDVVNLLVIIINLFASIALTFDDLRAAHESALTIIEAVTVAFFAVDYVLRVWTSDVLYPGIKQPAAALRYMISAAGLVDLLSFLPYYIPTAHPVGAAAFRLFRVMRIFKLFRIGAYSDSLSIIKTVIYNKRQQLYSSLFIIVVLMIASSLCMYGAEHEAQPEVFRNALSGIWWSASTLLTVGYGDIYPVTPVGQLLGTIIAFLGVGVVAIPTGIISAGFIEQYSELKRESMDRGRHFLKVSLTEKDAWTGRRIQELDLPGSMVIWSVIRAEKEVPARHELILEADDILVIRTETLT